MNDEPLTHDETVQLLRILQNEVQNLRERLQVVERHVHTTPELLESVSGPRYWDSDVQPDEVPEWVDKDFQLAEGGTSVPFDSVSSPLA